MIEALHTLLRITRGPPRKTSHNPTVFATPEKHGHRQLSVPTPSPVAPMSPATLAPAVTLAAAPAAPSPPVSAPVGNLRETVVRVLKEHSGDVQGFTAAALAQKIGNVSESDLKACLAALTDEGEIFNTIDDEHFSA